MEECERERRTALFAMESVKTGCSTPVALNVASAVDDRIIDCNATKTNPIAPNTGARIFGCGGNDARGGADGNDFISASRCINAGQGVKPGEAWSAAPAGTTVLGSGPTWGVYESVSGEQTWVGVSATPADVSIGSVIDAGEGNDQALGSWARDTIYMGAGNDLAQGLAGRDVIYGQDGDDRLYGAQTRQAISSTPCGWPCRWQPVKSEHLRTARIGGKRLDGRPMRFGPII